MTNLCHKVIIAITRYVLVTNLDILHVTQYYLSIEHVRQFPHHLTLNRQLLVEQRQIILQLSMRCDEDSLSFGVVLRTTSSTKHLKSQFNVF